MHSGQSQELVSTTFFLPDDVWHQIIKYLNPSRDNHTALVDKRLRNLFIQNIFSRGDPIAVRYQHKLMEFVDLYSGEQTDFTFAQNFRSHLITKINENLSFQGERTDVFFYINIIQKSLNQINSLSEEEFAVLFLSKEIENNAQLFKEKADHPRLDLSLFNTLHQQYQEKIRDQFFCSEASFFFANITTEQADRLYAVMKIIAVRDRGFLFALRKIVNKLNQDHFDDACINLCEYIRGISISESDNDAKRYEILPLLHGSLSGLGAMVPMLNPTQLESVVSLICSKLTWLKYGVNQEFTLYLETLQLLLHFLSVDQMRLLAVGLCEKLSGEVAVYDDTEGDCSDNSILSLLIILDLALHRRASDMVLTQDQLKELIEQFVLILKDQRSSVKEMIYILQIVEKISRKLNEDQINQLLFSFIDSKENKCNIFTLNFSFQFSLTMKAFWPMMTPPQKNQIITFTQENLKSTGTFFLQKVGINLLYELVPLLTKEEKMNFVDDVFKIDDLLFHIQIDADVQLVKRMFFVVSELMLSASQEQLKEMFDKVKNLKTRNLLTEDTTIVFDMTHVLFLIVDHLQGDDQKKCLKDIISSSKCLLPCEEGAYDRYMNLLSSSEIDDCVKNSMKAIQTLVKRKDETKDEDSSTLMVPISLEQEAELLKNVTALQFFIKQLNRDDRCQLLSTFVLCIDYPFRLAMNNELIEDMLLATEVN